MRFLLASIVLLTLTGCSLAQERGLQDAGAVLLERAPETVAAVGAAASTGSWGMATMSLVGAGLAAWAAYSNGHKRGGYHERVERVIAKES